MLIEQEKMEKHEPRIQNNMISDEIILYQE